MRNKLGVSLSFLLAAGIVTTLSTYHPKTETQEAPITIADHSPTTYLDKLGDQWTIVSRDPWGLPNEVVSTNPNDRRKYITAERALDTTQRIDSLRNVKLLHPEMQEAILNVIEAQEALFYEQALSTSKTIKYLEEVKLAKEKK